MSTATIQDKSAWWIPLGDWRSLRHRLQACGLSISQLENMKTDTQNHLSGQAPVSCSFTSVQAWLSLHEVVLQSPTLDRLIPSVHKALLEIDQVHELTTRVYLTTLDAVEAVAEGVVPEVTPGIQQLVQCAHILYDASQTRIQTADTAPPNCDAQLDLFFRVLDAVVSKAGADSVSSGALHQLHTSGLPCPLLHFLKLAAAAIGSAQIIDFIRGGACSCGPSEEDDCCELGGVDDTSCWVVAALAGNLSAIQSLPALMDEDACWAVLLAACMGKNGEAAQVAFRACRDVCEDFRPCDEQWHTAAQGAAQHGTLNALVFLQAQTTLPDDIVFELLRDAAERQDSAMVQHLLHGVDLGRQEALDLLQVALSVGCRAVCGLLLPKWLQQMDTGGGGGLDPATCQTLLACGFKASAAAASALIDAQLLQAAAVHDSTLLAVTLQPALQGGCAESVELALRVVQADFPSGIQLSPTVLSAAMEGGSPICMQLLLEACSTDAPLLAHVHGPQLQSSLCAALSRGFGAVCNALMRGSDTVSQARLGSHMQRRGPELLLAAVRGGCASDVQMVLQYAPALDAGANNNEALRTAVRSCQLHVVNALVQLPAASGVRADQIDKHTLTAVADTLRHDILHLLMQAPCHPLDIAAVGNHCLQVSLRRARTRPAQQRQQLRFLAQVLEATSTGQRVNISVLRAAVRLLCSQLAIADDVQGCQARIRPLQYLLCAAGGGWRKYLMRHEEDTLGVRLPNPVPGDAVASCLSAPAVATLRRWEFAASFPGFCRQLCLTAAQGWGDEDNVGAEDKVYTGPLSVLGAVAAASRSAAWGDRRLPLLRRMQAQHAGDR